LVRAILVPNALAIMQTLNQQRHIWSLIEIHCKNLRGGRLVLAVSAAINSRRALGVLYKGGIERREH